MKWDEAIFILLMVLAMFFCLFSMDLDEPVEKRLKERPKGVVKDIGISARYCKCSCCSEKSEIIKCERCKWQDEKCYMEKK